MYLTLPQNTLGNDYVVGDVHGCFSTLAQALTHIGFDAKHDRLISVGDLIDRGPDNHLVADWLDEPCNFSVLGNHEYQCLSGRGNECDWLNNSDPELQSRIKAQFRKLPVVIDIVVHWGKVGVVHAQVPTDVEHWQQMIDMAKTMNFEQFDRHECIWGRSRIRQQQDVPYHRVIAGVDLILCGHTQTQTAQRIGNHLFIDTGLYQGVTGYADVSKLTLVNVTNKTMHLFTIRNGELDEASYISFAMD